MLKNTGKTRFKKGHIPWNKGKKGVYSKEVLNNWSKKRKGTKNPHTIEQNKKIGDSMRGEKSIKWKGGIDIFHKDVRRSGKYKVWRKSVLIRDNFICQKTKISGGKLVVHHINNFAEFPELRFDINNGITLSQKAHIDFHKIYGSTNNTREQLQEFLKS